MIKKSILGIITALMLFSGCASDAWLFPIQHEWHKLKIGEAILIHYLNDEAKILNLIDATTQNVFFIEQNVPWWKFGRPSKAMIKDLTSRFNEKFLIRTVRDITWEDIFYGDELIDRGPKDSISGLAGEILSIDEIEWQSNCQVNAWFWVSSGELNTIRYKCDLTLKGGNWQINSMIVFHNLY